MKKAILMSIKPKYVAEILNHRKTIEIRKTSPKCDLPIDVYIYCTKGDSLHRNKAGWWFVHDYPTTFITEDDLTTVREQKPFNGKVVAKFALRKVERFIQGLNEDEYERLPNFALQDYDYHGLDCLMEKACLNDEEINEYAPDLSFYAWHISDLEIFDEPKELDGFDYPNPSGTRNIGQRSINGLPSKKHPPQSFCYIEID